MSIWKKHEVFEKHSLVLVIGILVVVAIGGLVEIAPLFYLKSTIEKVEGMRPYTPLELAGRNVYIREGCYLCHSQMVRPMRDELERYASSRPLFSQLRAILPLGLPSIRQEERMRARQCVAPVMKLLGRAFITVFQPTCMTKLAFLATILRPVAGAPRAERALQEVENS